MFERYAEKARRVIFFARYEASQLGSSKIETEHLLLGLLREDTNLTDRLARSPVTPEIICRRNMPLGPACKAVLMYASEEAERLAHQPIGTDRMVLGLLREGNGLAAKLLDEAGFDISKFRAEVGGAKETSKPDTARVDDVIGIHGESFNAKSVRELSAYYRRFHWEKRRWVTRDALVERSSQTLYFFTGQSYDPEQFELCKNGWNEDHCVICWWKIFDSNILELGEGYTNGQDWLCIECYQRFVGPERSINL